MFNKLLDATRKVSEDFEEEHGLGKEDSSSDFTSIKDFEEDEVVGFDGQLIEDMNLVAPRKKREEYDQEQLDTGISVEAEHTSNPELAAVIAANHLDEIPDYYTRLKAMEDEAKEEEDTTESEEQEEEEEEGELSDLEGKAETSLGQ
jgi:hypothetical protein